ncbi:hypothetical protein [Devosia chinhatensis]|uniref:RiboL-PSP-HEPN domain-containing protein n=1 Tax=Devosia chinhatensis TaxID=429727 RepID=A0A0F5FJP3_9HYPH|nr:hypothetical protein [Devosia chinhatensis]KKB08795.1 hypothetical protein VE26_01610 [Devosia chinhatensis]
MTIPHAHVIDRSAVPAQFPTHLHEPKFWEALGRAVATLGFLEEVLGKAIFALTATRRYPADEIDEAFAQWLPTLERALYDPLGGLIDNFGAALRKHEDSTISNLSDLLDDMRELAKLRNVLCHGSWRAPDQDGRSVPFFVNKKMEIFTDPIDVAYLIRVQQYTSELIATVIDVVTHMGWQFPGSLGPGRPIVP